MPSDLRKIYEKRTSKMKFIGVKKFIAWILISKMGIKMILRIITKNHEADPELGFFTKSIWQPYGRSMTMPPASELRSLKVKTSGKSKKRLNFRNFYFVCEPGGWSNSLKFSVDSCNRLIIYNIAEFWSLNFWRNRSL